MTSDADTTDRRPAATRRAKHAAEDVEPAVEVEETDGASCNVCDDPAEWRGLCAAHRQTHRGLADPKEPR